MPASRHQFVQLLDERVVLLDGGMGSLLIGMGLQSGQAPEWWNLEFPDRVATAHRGYVEAGSDVIHANTFGATPPKLEAVGLAGRCAEVNAAAVRIAREAAGNKALVAGDIGPTGKMLPPMGTVTVEELSAAFSEQSTALAEAGADLLSIETMYDLREALAAVKAAVATGLPVIASMTFDKKPRGHFTIVGDRITPALSALAEAGAIATGFNCSVEADAMLEMVREAAAETTAPIVAQPNAGQPRPSPEGVKYDANPDDFTAALMAIVEAGARVVGGCCGTEPSFIRTVRAALDARER